MTEAPYSADRSGSADCTDALQRALDDVGTQGGGTVYLPPGTYRLVPPDASHVALHIRHSHVVPRGAGRDRTVLLNDAYVMRSGSVILARPDEDADTDWFDPVGDAVPLAADAQNGADRAAVEDASSFSIGDRIVVKANATAEWIAEHYMTGLWNPGGGLIRPTFMRRVREPNGNEIGLDADWIDATYRPWARSCTATRRPSRPSGTSLAAAIMRAFRSSSIRAGSIGAW